MSDVKYEKHSDGQTSIYTITWIIPDFMDLLRNKRKRELRAENPKDSCEIESNLRFHLKIQLKGHDNDIIEIYYLTPNPVFLKSILSVFAVNSFGQRAIHEKEYHVVQANRWQYLTTLFKRDINSVDGFEKFLLRSGNLKLQFKFHVMNDIKIDKKVNEPQISNDFENLLSSGLFYDVIMKSAEGNEYKVHKAVLATRSTVLRAHFQHNTTECHTNIVETPLEAEVLAEVLTFIYSDKVPKIDNIPEKLLAAADYYQLCQLKLLCEEALHKKLTIENAIQTLELADLHSANLLKQSTLEFIKDGQAQHITRTEGWAKIKSVELIKTIYDYIISDDVELDIK